MPEDNVWEKRWNTLKNWLAEQQRKDSYDDPHYHMMDSVEGMMQRIEEMGDGK
jgi:hypothetical protein